MTMRVSEDKPSMLAWPSCVFFHSHLERLHCAFSSKCCVCMYCGLALFLTALTLTYPGNTVLRRIMQIRGVSESVV